MTNADTQVRFTDLGLPAPLLKALEDVGYETPSPIQAESIPVLLDGHDLLGQAQTGTGKTAAFALPLLARIDLKKAHPQLLVLAPTRELAIQVAEALQTYAKHLPDFHVLPIYGGQSYTNQLRQLKRGVHVVVGTPGRIMDHMRRESLKLDKIQAVVLDEADEMLRMGFIDDVRWILEHTPEQRQVALFSATMPKEIRSVADTHLKNPHVIKIASKTTTASTIKQRFWPVAGIKKLDALTRILETEEYDGVIVFVRTKTMTLELAERLSARGYACEALNGDIPQAAREKTVDRLHKGRIDILVATDVVARGLDVPRISHVINFDIPHDVESYVHRIGRTGRAGREGQAILFVAPRERYLLRSIERTTNQKIEPLELPSVDDVNVQRLNRFKVRITETLESGDLSIYYRLVSEYEQEAQIDPLQLAAALAKLAQGEEPLLLKEERLSKTPSERSDRSDRPRRERSERNDRSEPRRDRGDRPDRGGERPPKRRRERDAGETIPFQRYRIAVGHEHGVKPGNIVGAIANEADLDSKYIGNIKIHDQFTLIDLPEGMPKSTFDALKKVWVCNQALNIEHAGPGENATENYVPNKGDATAPAGGKKRLSAKKPRVPSTDKKPRKPVRRK